MHTVETLKLELKYTKNALKREQAKRTSAEMQLSSLKNSFEEYKANEEIRIQKAVEEAVKLVSSEYIKIINDLNTKIAKLESRLDKDSSNSSIPSSKNAIGKKVITNQREKSEKNIGGQNGHKRHILEAFKEEEITKVIEHTLNECTTCHGTLEYYNTVISDIIDVEFEVTKTRNNIYQYKCKCCNEIISSNTKLPRGTSYGPNINAEALGLVNDANVALNKVRKHIFGITNEIIDMSEGYIAKLQARTAGMLNVFCADLKEAIIKLEVLHWDDTIIKVGTKNSYLRFYGNESLALLIAHDSKNADGIEEDNILNRLNSEQTVMHDHVLYNYNEKFEFKNGECNSHILRYLKGVKDNITEHSWQDKLSVLLKDTNEEKKELENKDVLKFSEEYLSKIEKEYEEIIKESYKENEELVAYHHYKSEEIKLIKRLDEYREAHLLFAYDFKVPFTNNTAERSFRCSKTKLKVSGLFQNINTAKNYANILSYIETCYRCGINKVQALVRLLEYNPFTVDELLSVA